MLVRRGQSKQSPVHHFDPLLVTVPDRRLGMTAERRYGALHNNPATAHAPPSTTPPPPQLELEAGENEGLGFSEYFLVPVKTEALCSLLPKTLNRTGVDSGFSETRSLN